MGFFKDNETDDTVDIIDQDSGEKQTLVKADLSDAQRRILDMVQPSAPVTPVVPNPWTSRLPAGGRVADISQAEAGINAPNPGEGLPTSPIPEEQPPAPQSLESLQLNPGKPSVVTSTQSFGVPDLSGQIKRDTEGDKAAIQKAHDELSQTVKNGMLKGEEQATAEDTYYKKRQTDIMKDQVDQQTTEQDRQKEMDQMVSDYRSLSSDVANSKITPWSSSSLSASNRIGLVLLTLGGKGDQAINQMNKMIDDDLQKQKYHISLKKGRVEDQGNLLQMARQKFGDERIAESAARAIKWEAAGQELQGILAKSKNIDQQQRGQQLLAQINEQVAKSNADMDQTKNTQLLQNNLQKLEGQKLNATVSAEEAKAGQGKQLEQGTIEKITDLQAQKKGLLDLQKMFEEKAGPTNLITRGKVPFTGGNDYEQARALQVVNLIHALTGAQFSAEEAKRDADMIPAAGTLGHTGAEQFKSLINSINDKILLRIKALKMSKFDISGIEANESVSSFKKAE